MRFIPLVALITLFASLIVLADSSPNQPVYHASPIQEDLVETFREPKNVLFSSNFGGASHVNWVLTILDELSQRGHNITFVTTDRHAKYARPYPHFNMIVLKDDNKMLESALSVGEHGDLYKVVGNIFEFANRNFEKDYPALKNTMSSLNIDVALCDFGAAAGCYEAAIATDTPYIVTEAFAMSSDTSAPYINNNVLIMRDSTTLRMGFAERFIDMFIKPVKAMMRMMPAVKKGDEKRRKVGCNISSLEAAPSVHRDNLKLVNSLYGIEAARPMGPLVEMVGPILPRKYNPLTPELKDFLDAHKRIVYIAFGQHAISSQEDKRKILIAILENVEAGVYDGFLWAARQGSEGFPDIITTQSGTTYNVDQMFDGLYPHHRFVRWAPQTAVVMHPSVSVFITHGGAGSFYEGLYAGKRLAVFPFFGDQFPNAHNVEHNELGVYLNHEFDQEQMNEMIRLVGTDSDAIFQKNVNRYKALIQIHSRHGRIRAADLVEEVLFVNKQGQLPYRYEASRQMSFVKAHNIDLYIVAAMIAVTLTCLIASALKVFLCNLISALIRLFTTKQKTT